MNWRDKLQIRSLAYVLIAVLLACAIVFAGIAGHFVLAEHFSAHVAALLTAAGFIGVAAVIFLVTKIVTSRHQRAPAKRQQPADQLEAALAENMEPLLGDWIRRNPGTATAIGLLVGAAAGYSESVRRVLLDTYNRYTDDQQPDD